jgi:hypothetical protein
LRDGPIREICFLRVALNTPEFTPAEGVDKLPLLPEAMEGL